MQRCGKNFHFNFTTTHHIYSTILSKELSNMAPNAGIKIGGYFQLLCHNKIVMNCQSNHLIRVYWMSKIKENNRARHVQRSYWHFTINVLYYLFAHGLFDVDVHIPCCTVLSFNVMRLNENDSHLTANDINRSIFHTHDIVYLR